MRHSGWRSLLVPALSLAALTACAGDGAGPAGPEAVVLADHTANPCDHDLLAPVISSVSATPNRLWPPNHKFVTVAVNVAVTDNFPGAIDTRITGVASSEPVDWLGDGHTAPDWRITGLLTVQLRSERSGLLSGRTYTIFIASTDACGNTSTSSTTVLVPHDQGKRS